MKKYISKKIVSYTLLTAIILNCNSIAFANNYTVTKSNIKINDILQYSTPSTVNIDDSIFISLRDISNTIDASIDWNSDKRLVTIKKDDKTLTIDLSTKVSKLNNNILSTETQIEIIDGYTYLPIRFVADAIGYNVSWDSLSKTIELRYPNKEYLFLFQDQQYYLNGEDTISFDEALNMAKRNNSSLKNLDESILNLEYNIKSLTQNIQTAEHSLNPSSEHLITLIRNLKKLELNETRKDLNETIIGDSIELSLINILNSIKTTLIEISTIEKTISVNEEKLKNDELKLSLGLESEFNVSTLRSSIEKSKISLQNLKISLNNHIANLKHLAKSDKLVALKDNNTTFKELDNFDLTHYINTKKSSDPSMIKLQDDVDLAKYNLNTYIQANEEKRDNEIAYNTAVRALNDGMDNLEKNITTAYNNLLSLVENNKVLLNSLEQAKSNYNNTVLSYNLGRATILDVKNAELAILNAEKDIENNKLNYSTMLFSFNRPYLLQ